MDYEHQQRLRRHEIDRVLPRLTPGQTVLEIGAGAGWQSAWMAEQGFKVIAIDVPDSRYNAVRVFPVTVYDGHTIPLATHTVDVVFSSNVLEHIPHVNEFQAEIARVLSPEGYAIHLMPTTAWRFWTSLMHYPFLAKTAVRRVRRRSASGAASGVARGRQASRARLRNLIWPARHGAVGNSLSELYYFNRRRWITMFRAAGWQIDTVFGNELFYTGYGIGGSALGTRARIALSRVLGSACLGYVVRPPR